MSRTKNGKKLRKRTNLRRVIVSTIVILLIIGGIWAFKDFRDKKTSSKAITASSAAVRSQNSVSYAPSTSSDQSISNSEKSNSTTQSSTSKTPTQSSTKNTATTPTPTSAKATITQVNVASDPVIVRSLVTGASSGTCDLTISQSGEQNIVLTNSVSLQNSTYSCPNFSIPFSSFPAGGNWTFTLTLNTGGGTTSNTWPEPVYINKSNQ